VKLGFEKQTLADLQYWVQQDKKIATKILKLLEHIERDPYAGIGKPEQLKHNLSGLWSRRINQEHRLVYKVEGASIMVYSCRYHY
jgi:toxin YoeB